MRIKHGVWKIAIPLYGAKVYCVVLKDSRTIYNKRCNMDLIFGSAPEFADNPAFSCYNNGIFGIFFSAEDLTPGYIAHEVFHCACRILEWIGHDLTPENHEPHAYLIDWITNWVYNKIYD